MLCGINSYSYFRALMATIHFKRFRFDDPSSDKIISISTRTFRGNEQKENKINRIQY